MSSTESEPESESEKGTEECKMPEEFAKIIKDFVGDIKTTFPEFGSLISKWWKNESFFNYIEDEKERNIAYEVAEASSVEFLFKFCQKKYPPRFFDILYQNEDMFKNEDSSADTEFLPHIHFKNLWNFEISDKTRETIWKYLQLILFSVIGSLENRDAFGESAKLFEAINEDDFKGKLEETLSKMQELFNFSEETSDKPSYSENENDKNEKKSENMDDNFSNIPNANDIHEHINGMLDGKLGSLAKEIAEETAANLNMDMENVTDMKDVFNKLIKNPTKLMGLVKNVGDKLDSRIKSGEIKESELIAEATEIMNKMKNMPGMGDIQSMLSKMGMGGKGGKVNTNAMEAQLNKNMKAAQLKEKIRAKAEANRVQKEQKEKELQAQLSNPQNNNKQAPALTDEQIISIFSTGEKVERTPRGANPQSISENNKQKGKKNKNKK
jgi:hypothetical protein